MYVKNSYVILPRKHNESCHESIDLGERVIVTWHFLFFDVAYSIWSNNASAADIMIRSYMLEHVESVFKNAGLHYDVLIDDVQQAIKDENPPLSPEVQDELEGRKGLRLFTHTSLYNYI